MIVHKTTTIRSFTTEAAFRSWFELHRRSMLASGFSPAEVKTFEDTGSIEIRDPEPGVGQTITKSEVRFDVTDDHPDTGDLVQW